MAEVKLPEGWINVTLNEVAQDISYGYTASSTLNNVGPKFLRITDIQNNNVQWSDVPYCDISDEQLAKFKLVPNDLVFARTGATVGKSYLIKNNVPEAVFASYLIRVRCVSTEIIKYAYLFFQSANYWNQIMDFSSGIGQPNVNGSKLKQLIIPLPSLAEQKIIAERLDSLLAQVATIKTRLDAIPTLLKRFRQSVLSAAVSGKLTEEWRVNNEYITTTYCEKWNWVGVPNGWRVNKYSEVVDSRLGKMLDKAKNSGVPVDYLGNINVRWFSFEIDSLQQIRVTVTEIDEFNLIFGDVLICEGGEPGRCAIWKNNFKQLIVFQKALHRARVSKEILPEWLAYNIKNDVDRGKNGTAILDCCI